MPYAWAMRWRQRATTGARATICHIGVPVVSVGNLTLGGTGKTPLVAWLGRWFRAPTHRRGRRQPGLWRPRGRTERRGPGVGRPAARRAAHAESRSRGGGPAGHRPIPLPGDPAGRCLPASPPRPRPGYRAAGRPGTVGFGHVFPRGTLREPLEGLRRAHVVALSRADMLEPADRRRSSPPGRAVAPRPPGWKTHAPRHSWRPAGPSSRWNRGGRPVAAFCGVGNPAGFRHTLAVCG